MGMCGFIDQNDQESVICVDCGKIVYSWIGIHEPRCIPCHDAYQDSTKERKNAPDAKDD